MNTEQERADLLPCPFCGSTNIEIQISTPDREGVPTNLICSDCGASGPWEYEQVNSHAKADAAWNRRAALQSKTAGLEKIVRRALQEGMWELAGLDAPMSESAREAIDHARRAEDKT